MIHVFDEEGLWVVWTDTEISSRDGRCIGSGKTKKEAIYNAYMELNGDLGMLKRLGSEEFVNAAK